ncbi:uncharacterized protein BDR25DRAFT_350046 [Lindgomyces ingoldianus]|uniref:Uncharacterized protein n=1 Tax=Lindgomyces ingoldianus TaxID=673940 RepID=A0ACB6R999_9PLEO|nr:uncharacterized protein BDR25DRAFT_350046 [Lindgomyces ingoldianus]KAF2475756.1 hypothetical protein BDR25DRAFT_350046 [Lindgomyces ingoldianus]
MVLELEGNRPFGTNCAKAGSLAKGGDRAKGFLLSTKAVLAQNSPLSVSAIGGSFPILKRATISSIYVNAEVSEFTQFEKIEVPKGTEKAVPTKAPVLPQIFVSLPSMTALKRTVRHTYPHSFMLSRFFTQAASAMDSATVNNESRLMCVNAPSLPTFSCTNTPPQQISRTLQALILVKAENSEAKLGKSESDQKQIGKYKTWTEGCLVGFHYDLVC